MTTQLITIAPASAAERLRLGNARLVDIREADEFARRHVKGALSKPVSTFKDADLPPAPGIETIFTCRTGMRTAANGDLLAASVSLSAYVLDGGVDAWAAAGLPVEEDRKAPLEIMRQVQIAAGSLILLGVGFGVLVHPDFFALSAFVGAGLMVAGVTGYCGMAKLLAAMPWNRRQAI